MKNKKYRKIELVFDNRESVCLPAKAIEFFCISGITKTIRQTNYGGKEKFFNEDLHCSGISIIVNEAVNDKNYCRTELHSEIPTIDRILNFRDINYVNLFYKDGSYDSFFVPWECSDAVNVLQKAQYNEESGELTIKIGKE